MIQMEAEKFSNAMLLFFKVFKSNLDFRLVIIDATGKRGQADDIRAITAEFHKNVLSNIIKIIAAWPFISHDDQYKHYLLLLQYANNMFNNESNAITILQAIKQNMQNKNVSIELINEAVMTHEAIISNTRGILALASWINSNTPEKYCNIKIEENSESFLDGKLANLRGTMTEELKISNRIKPKAKI